MISNFVRFIKDSFLQNYKILFLSILIACLSFPEYTLYYNPFIDGPLPWVFNYFADGHFQVGKDLLFPHGPLAFLLYPLPVGNNLHVTILISFLISVCLSLSVYKIYFSQKSQNYLLPTLLLLILHAALDLQLRILALCLSQFLLFELKEKKSHLYLALVFSVINLFIKSYGGIIGLLLMASVFLYQVVIKKDYKQAAQMVLGFFLFFFVVWMSLYHSLNGAFTFLRGQYELSADNSEAVSFYQVNNWWWISFCFLSFLSIPFISKERTPRLVFFWMVLPLFGAWKHAMSRGDEPHVSGFLSFLFLVCFMIWLLSEEGKTGLLFAGILSLSSFTMHMASTAQYNDYSKQKEIALFRPFNLYNLLCYGDSISKEMNHLSKKINANEVLPDSLRKIIGNKSVDVYPWNHSIIAINHLNWVFRPSLHSYTSYTSWLDEQNAKQIIEGRSAEYMIWQIDNLGGKLYDIDQRYLLNNAPKTILEFFRNYSLIFKSSRYLVYRKTAETIQVSTVLLVPVQKVKFNTWIDVPKSPENHIIRAKARFFKSLLGIIKSTVYKGEAFSIYYELDDGNTFMHKIVPKNAKDGLWIDPLVLKPERDETEAKVKRIKLKCWDERMVDQEFSIEFEGIRFKKDSDFLWRAFGKRDSSFQH